MGCLNIIMKEYRLRLVVTNGKGFKDQNTLRYYKPHEYNVIENHYFNAGDKAMIWDRIKESYPDLNKKIEIYKRSNPVELKYDFEFVKHIEELVYKN